METCKDPGVANIPSDQENKYGTSKPNPGMKRKLCIYFYLEQIGKNETLM